MSAGFDLTVKLDDAALDAALSRAVKEGADMRRPMGEIAGEWMDHVRGRFAQERDPFGAPWTKRRGNVDPERPLLQLDRHLLNAVVPDFGSDFAQVGVLKTAGPAKYARIHNEGGTIKPREKKALSFGGRLVAQVVMPKRQYVGFGPEEERTVGEVMTDFVRDLFAKEGT
jgi:phage gpG-like protein